MQKKRIARPSPAPLSEMPVLGEPIKDFLSFGARIIGAGPFAQELQVFIGRIFAIIVAQVDPLKSYTTPLTRSGCVYQTLDGL